MPSSDRIETEPAASQEVPGEASPPGCAAAGLQDKLEAIAGQIGDADRRHRDALNDLEERLSQFGRHVDQARAGLPEQHAEALGRIEEGIADLAHRIAAFARERQSQRAAGGRAGPPSVPGDPSEPWDAKSAEALTRVYEMAEADQRNIGARRRPQPLQAQAPASQPAQATAITQAWLEARLSDMSALLQQALAANSSGRSLSALDRRLDQFEQRLEAALDTMPARIGREDLGLVEAHVKELAAHFEATSRQLARLDAIDGQLQVLGRALEEQHLRAQAAPTQLSEEAIATLIDTAAERAAGKLAPSIPTPAPMPEAEGQKRFDMLEGLLQDYVAERRRAEEVTTGILHTIEDALIRIVDRVDAMEVATSAPFARGDGNAADRDAMEAESERLAEAYAAGARVLGQKVPDQASETMLDAADYAPSPGRGEGASPADPAASSPQGSPTADAKGTREELRASVLRGKLKAQAKAEEPGPSLGEVKPGAGKPGRIRMPSGRSGRRFSVLLAVAMALLFGASYLAVDTFLMHAPAAETQKAAAPQPALEPAASLVVPKADRMGAEPKPASAAGAPDPAPGTAEEKARPVPVPQPAQRRHVPETVTDDLSEAKAPELRHRVGLETHDGVTAATLVLPAGTVLSPR